MWKNKELLRFSLILVNKDLPFLKFYVLTEVRMWIVLFQFSPPIAAATAVPADSCVYNQTLTVASSNFRHFLNIIQTGFGAP